MWANSCANRASICTVDSPVKQPTGTSTIGRSQPMTVGTSTTAECTSATARSTPSRWHILRNTSSYVSGMSSAGTNRILRMAAIPMLSRPRNSTTPAIHTAGTHGTARSSASFARSFSGTGGAFPSSTAFTSNTSAGSATAALLAASSVFARRTSVIAGSATISASATHAAA